MQAKRPALLHQVPYHRFQVLFHGSRQVRARFKEVFEIRRREHQHFPGTVVPQEIVALAVARGTGPVLEVGQFFLGLLGKQVVGDAHGQLLVLGQLLDDLVVVRVILITTAGVDRAGDPQAIEFAHELPGRVDLVLQRQFRSFGQRRIENHCVGPGDQHASGIAVGIALDFAAWRVRRIAGISHHFQRGAIE
ncbi:hypothetical protein D3C76_931000 [compost metagenome]